MRRLRILVFACLCGVLPMAWNWLLDGHAPDYSAARWAVFLGGVLVIAGGALVVDSVVQRRRAVVTAPGTASAGDRAPRAGR